MVCPLLYGGTLPLFLFQPVGIIQLATDVCEEVLFRRSCTKRFEGNTIVTEGEKESMSGRSLVRSDVLSWAP